MTLIRTLTISTTTFERMKEKFNGFRQTALSNFWFLTTLNESRRFRDRKNGFPIEHFENKILRTLNTRLDLWCFSPALNKACILQECTQLTQNQHTLSGLSSGSWRLYQNARLLNTGSVHSRSNLVLEQSRLRQNVYSGMLYCSCRSLSRTSRGNENGKAKSESSDNFI